MLGLLVNKETALEYLFYIFDTRTTTAGSKIDTSTVAMVHTSSGRQTKYAITQSGYVFHLAVSSRIPPVTFQNLTRKHIIRIYKYKNKQSDESIAFDERIRYQYSSAGLSEVGHCKTYFSYRPAALCTRASRAYGGVRGTRTRRLFNNVGYVRDCSEAKRTL